MAIEIPETHRDLIDEPRTAVLTTIGPDGKPQSTAVWFLVDDDGELKTSILDSRQKLKNLRANPAASLMVVDAANPFRYVEVRADVELLPDPEKSMLPKFTERYGVDVSGFDPPGSERAIAVFKPYKVVTFG